MLWFSKRCPYYFSIFFITRISIIAGIKSGVVKPLPRTVFHEKQVEEAFRFLSSGKHRGKVLIQIRKEEPGNLKSPSRTIEAVPRIFFDPQKSYVIVGGLGGVGIELTDWMIKKGATKIVLNSRRGLTNGYQRLCFEKWSRIKNVHVVINTQDSSNKLEARNLMLAAEEMGPVGGKIGKYNEMFHFPKSYVNILFRKLLFKNWR